MNLSSTDSNCLARRLISFRSSRETETQPKASSRLDLKKTLGILFRFMFEKKQNTVPDKAIPITSLTQDDILNLPQDKTSVIRLGHSTLLIKINNQLWLLDPVFSERASPVSFAGPKRFHQPPIDIEDIPELDGIIVSHNHYDHMDEYSIKKLHQRTRNFLTPYGNAEQLIKWGVNKNKITEFQWWQSLVVDGVELISTPAQHFSGRGLNDKNKSLWSSWVIRTQDSSLFFSADSGYFNGFKTIGERLGPFDLTMMEAGAYDKHWPDVHMTPEQSIQAHIDLNGKKMLPIHNGTFDLAFHSWTDPFEQLVDIADKEWVDLLTPQMGQVVTLGNEASIDEARDLFWWR